MGAKSQPISHPFWHKAGLPPSKKYLLVRQPLVCLKNQAVNDTLSSDYAASRNKQISEHSHQKLQEKIGVIKYG